MNIWNYRIQSYNLQVRILEFKSWNFKNIAYNSRPQCNSWIAHCREVLSCMYWNGCAIQCSPTHLCITYNMWQLVRGDSPNTWIAQSCVLTHIPSNPHSLVVHNTNNTCCQHTWHAHHTNTYTSVCCMFQQIAHASNV